MKTIYNADMTLAPLLAPQSSCFQVERANKDLAQLDRQYWTQKGCKLENQLLWTTTPGKLAWNFGETAGSCGTCVGFWGWYLKITALKTKLVKPPTNWWFGFSCFSSVFPRRGGYFFQVPGSLVFLGGGNHWAIGPPVFQGQRSHQHNGVQHVPRVLLRRLGLWKICGWFQKVFGVEEILMFHLWHEGRVQTLVPSSLNCVHLISRMRKQP